MEESCTGKEESLTSPAPAQSALGPSRSLHEKIDTVSRVLTLLFAGIGSPIATYRSRGGRVITSESGV